MSVYRGLVLVLVLIVAALVVGLVRSNARTDRVLNQLDRTNTSLDAARAEAASWQQQASVLQDTLDARAQRFRLMSFACARLVNHYDEEMERVWLASSNVAFQGATAEYLRSYLEGEAQSIGDEEYFTRSDRVGCGMTLSHPDRFPRGQVEPIPNDWQNGAAQPPP